MFGGAACQRSTEIEPIGLAIVGTRGKRQKLETEMPSTFQAWMSRKIVVTLTEISKSAGRADWGGGNNDSQFGYVESEVPSSHARKDVKQADTKEVPVSKHLLRDKKAHPNTCDEERLMCAYEESADELGRKRWASHLNGEEDDSHLLLHK